MSAFVKGTWNGWSDKTVVELTDGTIWQQAEYHYEYHYAYQPAASVANGSMTVAGMSRAVRVRQVPSSSRLTVKGAWKGWNGHTTVELADGSKWLQAEYHYEYHYAYRPEVLLIDDQMQVEGMSRPVRVRKIS